MSDEQITQTEHKKYLGDGVYADIENGMLKLTAEDGIRATNTIYLEPVVMEAFMGYVLWLEQQLNTKTNKRVQ